MKTPNDPRILGDYYDEREAFLIARNRKTWLARVLPFPAVMLLICFTAPWVWAVTLVLTAATLPVFLGKKFSRTSK